MTELNRTRVTYIVSNLNKALAFEWIATGLNAQIIDLSFILLNPADSALEQFLRAHRVPVVRIIYRGKKDLPSAVWRVFRQLRAWQTQVVHTHLFDANVVGLTAAALAGVPKRILTRHHSTLHHEYFPRAVYYDRYTNSIATDIVAITDLVYRVLVEREAVPPHKVHLIHHGFDLRIFEQPAASTVDALRDKYATAGHYPVVGVIARQTEWKGIQYIIPAFAQVLALYPAAKLLLANAHGDYKAQITALLQEYLPESAYQEISFETELGALYQLFDVYAHTPIDNHSEAFGQTYVEALAAGVPSVFTLSGVAPEFIRNRENALVVPFANSQAIADAILELLTDEELRTRCQENGRQAVRQQFSLPVFLEALTSLYTRP